MKAAQLASQDTAASLPMTAACVASLLAVLGHHYPCSHDPGHAPHLAAGTKVLVAGALKSNEPIMAQFTTQLLRLVLAPPLEPAPEVFVSLYESASTDDTPMYMAVIRHLMAALKIPAVIVST